MKRDKRISNTKGETLSFTTVIGVVFVAVITISLMTFIISYRNNGAIWEEWYAKEIARAINLAQPGDEITLDIHKATEIAKNNNLQSYSEIISFDNSAKEVCVKLSAGRKSCYPFFNKVDVVDWKIVLAGEYVEGNPVNILTFSIKKTA